MDIKIFINGTTYTFDDLPYIVRIPDKFFIQWDDFCEARDWLNNGAEDIYWISFHDHTVRFRSESDAIHFKLVIG